MITLEEDIYESKSVQLELLENLKNTEDKLEQVMAQNATIEDEYEQKLQYAK